ncbi:monooxygenase family protein [Actinophytocola sp.]|uniref:monooxygenase family protein n=1 Tax=Actinophytocola sp. TaxID=1872138 RepID=UPI003D6B40AC
MSATILDRHRHERTAPPPGCNVATWQPRTRGPDGEGHTRADDSPARRRTRGLPDRHDHQQALATGPVVAPFRAMSKMLRELSEAEESGLLGHRLMWEGRNPTLIQYWDSMEKLYSGTRLTCPAMPRPLTSTLRSWAWRGSPSWPY